MSDERTCRTPGCSNASREFAVGLTAEESRFCSGRCADYFAEVAAILEAERERDDWRERRRADERMKERAFRGGRL